MTTIRLPGKLSKRVKSAERAANSANSLQEQINPG